MTPVLVLVDLQEDFISEPGLEPHRDTVVAGAGALLSRARAAGVRVLHVHTKVEREPDRRMRHWRETSRWSCLAGTPGQLPPEILEPCPGEQVIEKSGFSAHPDAVLEGIGGAGLVVVAGVHTHACVRQAALGFHEAGIDVCIARDAVGSHEPAHAAQTEAYLRARLISFRSNSEIFEVFETGSRSWASPGSPAAHVHEAVQSARSLSTRFEERIHRLRAAADLVDVRSEMLARAIVDEVGKPIRQARGEVARTAALFRAVADRASHQRLEVPEREALVRRAPLGRIALITPWNNPIAIAAGQIAPGYVYGNSLIWKPSPLGRRCAGLLHELLLEAGVEAGGLQLVGGGGEAGFELVQHREIDGVCFTGATATGRVVAALCSQRNLPLQAELGGNNAAILAESADLDRAARLIAEAAFGYAGQRCTATRRAIVPDGIYERLVALLEHRTASLVWGDPWDEETVLGPMIASNHAGRVADLVERARASGHRIIQPHERAWDVPDHPPTIVLCDDPQAEIVQEETFGPVLVVQRSASFTRSLCLLNGVRHGLAAALFSNVEEEQQSFLHSARAGILKINQATVEAGVDVPFGGWKGSGMGPPQHGAANAEFFTRAQVVYR